MQLLKQGWATRFILVSRMQTGRETIRAFEVIVNGKGNSNPEMKMTSAMTGGATSFVFQATAPGTYHFDITPIIDGERGERRLNTLEVEE